MTVCNRCGEIVEGSNESDAKAVLKFCMLHNLTTKDLRSVVDGRFAKIASDYDLVLTPTQQDMIKDLVGESLKVDTKKPAEQ
jgi:hypothetical protein